MRFRYLKAIKYFLAAVLIFCASSAQSKTLYVPEDYKSIQKAIDLSERGDTIQVAPGIYYENITLRDGRNLVGIDPERTIITDDEKGPPDPVIQVEGNCLLEGVTITGCRGSGVGHALMITRGGPQIINNIIRDNSFTGVGIHSETNMTNPLVKGNKIYGNGGAGIANLGKFAQPTIVDNQVFSNTNAGIASTDYSTPIIENNIVTNNGIGMVAREGASAVIIKNVIKSNRMVGMAVIRNGDAIVKDNEIVLNTTVGVNVDSKSKIWLVNNKITDNAAEGVAVKGESEAYVAYNVISAGVPIALQFRKSKGTVVKNVISTAGDPNAIDAEYTNEFGETKGGVGPSVFSIKGSNVRVAENNLGGKIDFDEESMIDGVPHEEIPLDANNIKMPEQKRVAEGSTEDPADEEKESSPILPPNHDVPKGNGPGCLGFF